MGKTVITGALTAAMRARGIHVGAMKPVASGAVKSASTLISEDASFLMHAAQMPEEERRLVNPYCLEHPLAPLVAAELAHVSMDKDRILQAFHALQQNYPMILVEGVGGISVPLGRGYLVSDMAAEMELPLIIVARPGLGTLNHTVLTVEYARQKGLTVLGVILNKWSGQPDNLVEQTNVDLIAALTGLPVIGRFPALSSLRTNNLVEAANQSIELDYILEKAGV